MNRTFLNKADSSDVRKTDEPQLQDVEELGTSISTDQKFEIVIILLDNM